MPEHRRKLIMEVEGEELAIRILEAMTEIKRPEGMSAQAIFHGLDEDQQAELIRACDAAMTYFAECMGNAQEPS